MAGVTDVIRYGVSLPNRTETPSCWQYKYREMPHAYRYRPNRPITTMFKGFRVKPVWGRYDFGLGLLGLIQRRRLRSSGLGYYRGLNTLPGGGGGFLLQL